MPQTTVQSPNGPIVVNHPDGATAEEIIAYAKAHAAPDAPPPPPPAAAPPMSASELRNAAIGGGALDPFQGASNLFNASAGYGALQGLSLGHQTDPTAGYATKFIGENISPHIYALLNPGQGGADLYRKTAAEAGMNTAQDYAAAQQARIDAARNDPAHPGQFGMAEAAAPLAFGAAGAELARGKSGLELLRALVKPGAAIGGISGAAMSDKPIVGPGADLAENALYTAGGAVAGGAISGTVPFAIPAARWVGQKAAGLSRSPAVVSRQAVDQLRPAFEALGMDEAQIQRYFAEHPEQLLADLLPTEAGAVQAGGGVGATRVETQLAAREAEKINRVNAQARDAAGIPRDATLAPTAVAKADAMAAAKNAARPYYGMSDQTPVVLNDTLEKLLADPHVAPLWAQSAKHAETRNLLGMLERDAATPKPTPPTAWEDMMSVLSGKPTPPGAMVPPTQGPTPTLMMKLQSTLELLGDKGAALKQAGEKRAGATLFAMKDRIGAELSRPDSSAYNPSFVTAQKILANAHTANEALDAGRRAIIPSAGKLGGQGGKRATRGEGQTILDVRDIKTPEQQRKFIEGGITGINELLTTEGNDLETAALSRSDQIATLWQNQGARDALQAVFGMENTNSYGKFLRVLQNEGTMHETYRLVQATGRDNKRMNAIGRLGGMMGTVLGISAGTGTAGVPFGARLATAEAMKVLAGKQQLLINAQKADILLGRDPTQLLQPRGPLADPRLLGGVGLGGVSAGGLLGNQ